jgi:hypothetical protein
VGPEEGAGALGTRFAMACAMIDRPMSDFALTLGKILLIVGLVAVTLAAVLLALVYRRLRRLNLAADAGFFTTLRAVPLGLVVALDLLDLGLDFLAAPVAWVILGRLRLQGLREVAVIESLIPLTQPIPLMTLSWLATRLLGLGLGASARDPDVIETERIGPGRYAPRKAGTTATSWKATGSSSNRDE